MFPIGHGVKVQAVVASGKPVGLQYEHPSKSGSCSGFIPFRSAMWKRGWEVVSEDPLSLSTMVVCRKCGHRGHIHGGFWVPA